MRLLVTLTYSRCYSGCTNGRTKNEGHRNGFHEESSGHLLAPSHSSHNNHHHHHHIPSFDPCLPVVEAHQRHALTLLRMEDLLNNGVSEGDLPCEDAKQLCVALIDFAYKLTVAKRRILEDPELYITGEEYHSAIEQKLKRRKLGEKLSMVPGKLDHASVVAYQVGCWPGTVVDGHRREKEIVCKPLEMETRIVKDCGVDKENVSPNQQPIPAVSALSLVCRKKHENAPPKESLV